MKEIVMKILDESVKVKEAFVKKNADRIVDAADRVAASIVSGHKILIFGNGGSAADAQHIAAEFINRFQIERRPLPAMALTTDTSVITSIANDYHFDEIFSKQIIALGRKDDMAIGISTSGNSPNVIRAIEAAREMDLFTIGFSGRGGKLAECADMVFAVESETTARIQETHITLGHILCDLIERILFPVPQQPVPQQPVPQPVPVPDIGLGQEGLGQGLRHGKMPFEPIDLAPLKTYSLSERESKVCADDFAYPWKIGGRFKDFLGSLPDILAATDIKAVIASIAAAVEERKTVMLAMGAHVIKVGLNPIVIDLMERGILTAVALNGAGIIHDFELAMTGMTSEDVAASLGDGTFGMARETGEFLSEAIRKAGRESLGLGHAVGLSLIEKNLPFMEKSILAAGARLGIPVTVHMAIGTDIIHIHPGFDPEAAGAASHRDFRIFASAVATLESGVYLNVGSAVLLPEVFLKALTLVRNLGHEVRHFTTVNMDFIRHYRPMTNVVTRPTLEGGKGYNLVGHHEIMLPLIAAGVIEASEK